MDLVDIEMHLTFYFPYINYVPEKLGKFNYCMFPLQTHF